MDCILQLMLEENVFKLQFVEIMENLAIQLLINVLQTVLSLIMQMIIRINVY